MWNTEFAKKIPVSVSVGGTHVAGITSSYRLFTWGLGSTGQLGVVQLATQSSPAFVKSIVESYTTISSGGSHTVALRADQALIGWGLNTSGQAGVLSWENF